MRGSTGNHQDQGCDRAITADCRAEYLDQRPITKIEVVAGPMVELDAWVDGGPPRLAIGDHGAERGEQVRDGAFGWAPWRARA
jgi:hypothetical protein